MSAEMATTSDSRLSRMLPRTLRRLLSLSRGELLLLIRMAVIATLLPLLHRVLPLPSLLRLLEAGRGPSFEPEQCVRIARVLLGRKVAGLRPNCLTQSLLVFNALRRAGHQVVILFGVAKSNGDLRGHCWLELGGQALAEESDPRPAFNVIYSYPRIQTAP